MADAKTYDYGLGRRKAATARARLIKGKGNVTINDKPAADYLSGNKTMLAEITDPLALVGKQQEFDVTIRVSGGGLAGQVDAIKMAIAKAITVAVLVSANNTQSAKRTSHNKYPLTRGYLLIWLVI
ncbi:30S ribosomal protein S9 [Candidatus Saccharibacteria bacterium 32-50-10]|nr:MAG: 30S ribosomal protein S9 [Candidatus Saccharibacteria bacterium 32-50-10]